MEVIIKENKQLSGAAAAQLAARGIQNAITKNGKANIILATGASQFEMLQELVQQDIDWSKVTAFHLDEYVGIALSHPASFRKYLKDRFVDQVDGLKQFHYIDAEGDVQAECDRLSGLIAACSIDVACVGIGENGHLAFNDPPADFDTDVPYIVVELDDACRRQQLGEGWFPSFEDVPQQAISMSIRQIMKSKIIVNTVPDQRKAEAVRNTLQGQISNLVPASILQKHPDCSLFLDNEAASLLKQ